MKHLIATIAFTAITSLKAQIVIEKYNDKVEISATDAAVGDILKSICNFYNYDLKIPKMNHVALHKVDCGFDLVNLKDDIIRFKEMLKPLGPYHPTYNFTNVGEIIYAEFFELPIEICNAITTK